MFRFAFATATAAALAIAAPAVATTFAFTGSVAATGGAAPDASCAPLPLRATVLPVNSSGTSSLGAFKYGQTLCTAGGPGPFSGTFSIDFGGDGFGGTFTGLAGPSGTPGVIGESFTYLVTSGTGRFFGSSGGFTGIGTLDPRAPPPKLALTFDGRLALPAVPEPDSWALFIAGFGLAGAMMRRANRGFAPLI